MKTVKFFFFVAISAMITISSSCNKEETPPPSPAVNYPLSYVFDGVESEEVYAYKKENGQIIDLSNTVDSFDPRFDFSRNRGFLENLKVLDANTLSFDADGSSFIKTTTISSTSIALPFRNMTFDMERNGNVLKLKTISFVEFNNIGSSENHYPCGFLGSCDSADISAGTWTINEGVSNYSLVRTERYILSE